MRLSRNKYSVAPKAERTWAGRVYDSKGEMLRAKHLTMLVQIGVLLEVIEQPDAIELGIPECKYRPDFYVTPKEGEPYYEDFKGTVTAKFKRDKKLWKAYGPCPLHIVMRKSGQFETVEVIDPQESRA